MGRRRKCAGWLSVIRGRASKANQTGALEHAAFQDAGNGVIRRAGFTPKQRLAMAA